MKRFIILFVLACTLCNLNASKKANILWLFLEQNESSVTADENISIDYYFGGPYGYYANTNPYLIITISNNSDSIVYIDLAGSYIMRNGNPRILYDADMQINSNSDISVSAFNIGIISVGDGNIQTNAKVNVPQRLIMLPPHAKKDIKTIHFFDDGEQITMEPQGILKYKKPFFNNPNVYSPNQKVQFFKKKSARKIQKAANFHTKICCFFCRLKSFQKPFKVYSIQ